MVRSQQSGIYGEEKHGLLIEKPLFDPKKPLFQIIDSVVLSKRLTSIIAGNVYNNIKEYGRLLFSWQGKCDKIKITE